MSDLYRDLQARIHSVSAQSYFGTERLQAAQDAVGLSNDGVARLIPVNEKTWRRWKERGEIPTSSWPAVAAALQLDISQDEIALRAELEEVRRGLADVQEVKATTIRIEHLLRELLSRPPEEEETA